MNAAVDRIDHQRGPQRGNYFSAPLPPHGRIGNRRRTVVRIRLALLYDPLLVGLGLLRREIGLACEIARPLQRRQRTSGARRLTNG